MEKISLVTILCMQSTQHSQDMLRPGSRMESISGGPHIQSNFQPAISKDSDLKISIFWHQQNQPIRELSQKALSNGIRNFEDDLYSSSSNIYLKDNVSPSSVKNSEVLEHQNDNNSEIVDPANQRLSHSKKFTREVSDNSTYSQDYFDNPRIDMVQKDSSKFRSLANPTSDQGLREGQLNLEQSRQGFENEQLKGANEDNNSSRAGPEIIQGETLGNMKTDPCDLQEYQAIPANENSSNGMSSTTNYQGYKSNLSAESKFIGSDLRLDDQNNENSPFSVLNQCPVKNPSKNSNIAKEQSHNESVEFDNLNQEISGEDLEHAQLDRGGKVEKHSVRDDMEYHGNSDDMNYEIDGSENIFAFCVSQLPLNSK